MAKADNPSSDSLGAVFAESALHALHGVPPDETDGEKRDEVEQMIKTVVTLSPVAPSLRASCGDSSAMRCAC